MPITRCLGTPEILEEQCRIISPLKSPRESFFSRIGYAIADSIFDTYFAVSKSLEKRREKFE
jgi:hypothetical protein